MLSSRPSPAVQARSDARSSSQVRPIRPSLAHPSQGRCVAAAAGEAPLGVREVADLISMRPLDDEQKAGLTALADALGVPLNTAKGLAFKKRALVGMSPEDIKAKIAKIASVVGVSPEQAREMAVIQPSLLVDTDRQAETLALGIRAICYELNAPKDEIVDLILKNQSVLHGREMHLSVSDIAHLAMLREPRGRIVD